MIYDPDTGIFDQSYAMAWQTGRMITLANNEASQAIFKWKQRGIALLNLLEMILDKHSDDLPISADQLKSEIAKTGVNNFIQYLSGNFGKLITGNENMEKLIPVEDPSGMKQHLGKIPGLVEPAALDNAISTGEDPNSSLILLNEENKTTN